MSKPTLEEMLADPTDAQRQLLAAIVQEERRIHGESYRGAVSMQYKDGCYAGAMTTFFDRLAAASKGEGEK